MTDYSAFKVLVDLPSEHPGLGFADTALGLCDLITNSEPRFSIAIFGPWGSGKTTLMNAIGRNLETHANAILVEFSAWRYEREAHLIVPLLDTIRAALVAWADRFAGKEPGVDPDTSARFRRAGLQVAQTVGKVMASVLAGLSFKMGIPGSLDLSYDANKALEAARRYGSEAGGRGSGAAGGDGVWKRLFGSPEKTDRFAKRLFDPNLPQSFYHACFSALEDAFRRFAEETDNPRIVVFVDDLDRCLPAGALEVLESMKLFFDLKGFVFVVGLDREVVERCIDSRYALDGGDGAPEAGEHLGVQPRLIKGSDYLKKIFQVPFSLAPVSYNMLDDLFASIRTGAGLTPAQEDDMRETVRPHLNNLFAGMRLNPREVKRYINAYTIQMKVKPNLNDPNIVLALNTLAFRQDCRSLYDAIATFRIEFTLALRAFFDNDPTALEDFDLKPGDIPDDIRGYLGEGGVAHALVTTQDIDAYLDAGEAARSSAGGYFLELLGAYREFRQATLRAFDAADPKSFDGEWSTASSLYHKLREPLMSFQKREGPSSGSMEIERWLDPSTGGQKWSRWLELMNRGDGTDAETMAQAKKEAVEEARRHLRTLQLELRRLRWHAQLETAW